MCVCARAHLCASNHKLRAYLMAGKSMHWIVSFIVGIICDEKCPIYYSLFRGVFTQLTL